jgi:hypothetical protein
LKPKTYFAPALPLNLNEVLPFDYRGFIEGEHIPIDWKQVLNDNEILRLAFRSPLTESETIPFEWGAVAGSLTLGLTWNDRTGLNTPLTMQWTVLSAAAVFTLQLTWNVVQLLAGLSLRWNVIPDVFTPFGIDPQTGMAIPPTPVFGPGNVPILGGKPSEDIHKPVAHVTKTP